MTEPTFNIGDRIRLVDTRSGQEHLRGWEGVVTSDGGWSTIRVRLYHPTHPNTYRPHEESYYPWRLEFIEAATPPTVLSVIHKLEKRQKFYQTYKQQLPTWYASYGD